MKELFGIEVPGTQITEEDIRADPTNNIETSKPLFQPKGSEINCFQIHNIVKNIYSSRAEEK